MAATGAIAGILLWFARSGLFVYLTGDDAMNIHEAWHRPYSRILLENVFFFTPGYRPMGALVYRLLFDTAGIHALPYRMVCYLLLLGNLYLLYRAAAAIAGAECGVLAALLASYNPGLADLYLNTGTIYDLLCFTFYFSALGLYISVRERNRLLSSRHLTAFLILYVCALNSKEMAATLPVVVLGYELIFRRPARRWWLPAALATAVTIPFALGKFAASSPLMGNDAYRLRLGLRIYFHALDHFLGGFSVSSGGPAMILLGAAALGRRRPSQMFALLFMAVSALPVAFIPLRGGYAAYIMSFGIALLLATLIVDSRDVIAGSARLLQYGTFVSCLVALLAFHGSRPLGEVTPADRLIRSTVEQIRDVQPSIDPRARILIVDDPFPLTYTPLFILRLYYRAPDLVVDRIKMMSEKPDPGAIGGYDCILTFDGARLARLKP